MKKKYEKPQVFFEQYELSHSVANCSAALNHSENDCVLDGNKVPDLHLDPGETIFSTVNSSCNISDELFEGYCYWTGNADNSIFTS